MNDPCQVDFYVLGNRSQTAEQLACRLAMMAWEQGYRIAVLTETADGARRLDELMWEHPAGRFLPHSRNLESQSAPVRIGTADTAIPADCDALINLSTTAIPEPERFKRLLEIVPGNEPERIASRQKFRSYRDRGLQPVSHTIGK